MRYLAYKGFDIIDARYNHEDFGLSYDKVIQNQRLDKMQDRILNI